MEHAVSAPNFTFLDSDFHFFEPEEQFYSNLSESPPLVYEHFADTSLLQSEASSMVKDRLIIAIEYLKEYVEDSQVLIQIWMPMKKGDQNVLTTIDQPYSLNLNCRNLASYRNVSKSFYLTTEEDSKESAGLPGRVFLGKFPEWSPDVRFFRIDECPRKNFAEMYEISGCLALPVFDHRNICLAVIEIVTTCQKISYHLEIEIVCKALEAVDLKSWQDFFPRSLKACNETNQIAIPEISETLQFICQTYRLPLAQTWTSHDSQFNTEIPSDYCISTFNSACYVADNDLLGFHKACSEQRLFLDQGIVGQAFASNKQRFATDITSLSRTNYPLSHHARMFNLGAAVAIPLRNMYTGLVQLVLELFLPRDCKDIEQQMQMWDLLSAVIQQACRSFRVVMDKEMDDRVDESPVIASIWTPYGCLKEELEDEFKITTQWDYNNDFEPIQQHSVIQDCSRASEKRQNKIEKTINLHVLRQYFAGSLKDAAKSIGVCPTTLKRICRQHGINRWPSRKINKVNKSLRKLQLVVNSIHGAEGLIQIDSFYKTFPEWNFAKVPEKDPFLSLKKSGKSNTRHLLNPNDKSRSSTSSQNSGSSICLSTEAKKLNRNECSNQKIIEERPKTSDRNDQTCQTDPELPKNTSGLRVKATFAEEHIRFSFLRHWNLKDLQQEIAKRFKIDDFSRIHLKYTDIDNELVLLTCDADLEECVDLISFSCSKIIKISLHNKLMLMQN
ncbi:protein NLP2-like [Euphorbia lathyris]|uniref:protein NLP2-like n=1 Tax=Euphorbia lathyris TaxID=212925 RepID=UPI003313F00E